MIESNSLDNIGESLKNRSRIEEAVRTQDRIRQKSGDWSGEEEVRKWRKKR